MLLEAWFSLVDAVGGVVSLVMLLEASFVS